MDSKQQQQKQSMAEPLLEQPLIQPAPEDHWGAWTSPTTILGFTFLTFNSAMAVSSWHRGYGAASFAVFSYLDLAVLFYCLRLHERLPPRSPWRELLKMAMWILATMHVIAFFLLLEFCFLLTSMGQTENSVTGSQDHNSCPDLNEDQSPPSVRRPCT